MHYNLPNGGGVDRTAVKLRVAASGAHLQPLHTLLLPAPVELPCPANENGPLCNRDASVFDVVQRFGAHAGRTVAGLQLLCGGSLTHPKADPHPNLRTTGQRHHPDQSGGRAHAPAG